MAATTSTDEPKAAPGAPTNPDPKLKNSEKIAWSVGGIADTIMTNGVLIYANQIYNIGLGVPAQWLGWAMAVPRIFDAIIDPLVGNISDNTRSRWGRRRPYIAIGGILGAIVYALIWMPPIASLTKVGLLVWFLITSAIFFFCYAIFSIPNIALGYELSPDTNVRTRIISLRFLLASTAGFFTPWLYKLALMPVFSGGPEAANAGVPPEVIGVRYVGIMVAIVILITALPAAIYCRERVSSQSQPKVKLRHAFSMVVHNRSFLILAGITFCGLVGVNLVGPLNLYISIYHISGGDKGESAWLYGLGGTLYGLVGLIASPLSAWCAIRWGKRRTLMAGLASCIFGFMSSLFFFTPNHPYWQLLVWVLVCPGLTAMWVITGAMLADLCDVDELATGLRREGMFGAIQAVVVKAGLAGTAVVGGYILMIAGFKEGAPTQSVETLRSLRLFYAFVPIIFMSAGVILTALFPITDARVREVRRLLDARKSAGSSAPPMPS